MRETLFRGKRVDNGDWVYGFYWYDQFGNRHMIQSIEFLKNGWNQEVIPDTVGQYTGMKDKNGKNIFEGDRVSAWQVAHQAVGEVKYRIDGLWIIYPANQHGKLWGMSPNPKGETKLEVIGTIHD